MRRTLVLLLAVLMLGSVLVSCSNDTAVASDTSASNDMLSDDTTSDITWPIATKRADAIDSLPDDLDFDGQSITFFYRGVELVEKGMMEGENNGGDVLYDAVYERNRSVEERLNVSLKFKQGPTETSKSESSLLRKEIPKYMLAGEADWDVLFYSAQFGFGQSLLGYFIDLMDFPYIDDSQPWWWNDYMLEESIDSTRRYMLNGDITLFDLMSASAAFYNKDMFTNKFGDTSELYSLVDDGMWTIEKFLEYCSGAYEDVNGDGTRDEDDVYGVRHHTHFKAINYLSLSNGVSMYTRDSDGLPVLDLYNETWVDWMDNIIMKYMSDEYSKLGINDKRAENYFTDEKSFFMMGMLYDADALRDTDFIYGIVPYPKYNEDYEYLSAGATPNAESIFIPITTNPTIYDAIGATLEALCAESYRNVTEKYYETTLKGKYADSENDIRMVDVIYNSIGTNFVMIAATEVGDAIGSIFSMAYKENSNLSSYYEKNRTKSEQKWSDMIQKYKDLDV